jgi:hypothetical protein
MINDWLAWVMGLRLYERLLDGNKQLGKHTKSFGETHHTITAIYMQP